MSMKLMRHWMMFFFFVGLFSGCTTKPSSISHHHKNDEPKWHDDLSQSCSVGLRSIQDNHSRCGLGKTALFRFVNDNSPEHFAPPICNNYPDLTSQSIDDLLANVRANHVFKCWMAGNHMSGGRLVANPPHLNIGDHYYKSLFVSYTNNLFDLVKTPKIGRAGKIVRGASHVVMQCFGRDDLVVSVKEVLRCIQDDLSSYSSDFMLTPLEEGEHLVLARNFDKCGCSSFNTYDENALVFDNPCKIN